MSTRRPSAGYHILALATIFVWGTTFASTKVLLTHGLTPPEIMLYRFIIAYALTWMITISKVTIKNDAGYFLHVTICNMSILFFFFFPSSLSVMS